MAEGNLPEADFPGDFADLQLVLRPGVGVHETHGQRARAVPVRLVERFPGGVLVKRRLHRSIGEDALFYGGDALIKMFGLDDPAGEDVRAGLIADLQKIAMPLRGEQQHQRPLALQKGVGGQRRADLHRADFLARQGAVGGQAEMLQNPVGDGVVIKAGTA